MINIALVGCGRIAHKHAELLGNKQINHARLAAVCDIDDQKAGQIGSKYEVPFYTDMHEMLKKEKSIDVISILTPSGMHAEHLLELVQYQKHFVVEKPLALTIEDADKMITECDRNGLKLFVVKQNRFNRPVVKLREALEEGRFGKLVMGTVRVRWCRDQAYYDMDKWRGTWAYDGGVFTNQASHHIDLLEWMLGDVESVYAKSRTALVDIEAEDTGVALLRFTNGALGVIEATTATRPNDLEGSLSILGEGGTVEIGGFAVNEIKTWQFVTPKPVDKTVMKEYSVNPPNVYGFGHKAYYDNVISCLETGENALVDGIEARRSLETINAIYESIETRKEVHCRFVPEKCKLGRRS